MPIDPRLQQKYTGKLPGEGMSRYGESLARQSARPKGDPSIWGALNRTVVYRRLIYAVIGLVVVVSILWGGKIL